MDLKVNIKNLGKLTDADICISKFTVFAGINNTGKSFASKALYSRLSCSLDDVSLLSGLDDYTELLRKYLDNLQKAGFDEDDSDLSLLLDHLDRIDEISSEITNVGQRNKISTFENNLPSLLDTCKNIGGMVAGMTDTIEKNDIVRNEADERGFDYSTFKEYLDFFGSMTEDKIRKIFTKNIEYRSDLNFFRNFQADKLSDLASDEGKSISVKIEAKSVMDRQEEYVKDYLNDENYSGLGVLDTFITDRALFLSSPVFWQLKNPLEIAGDGFKFGLHLSGVPEYFYDMVRALKSEYMGVPISSDVLDRLTGEHGINGKVSVAANGEMIYTENNGVTVPLVRAATGIADLGVLALLIEQKILKRNSFIFVDEPETHLHPEWQVEMVDALFKLAEAGVNVVIATHSAEIIKWLEVHVKEKPEAKNMIALNHFRKDGSVESSGRDFDERLNTIQEELSYPYYRLFYKGI